MKPGENRQKEDGAFLYKCVYMGKGKGIEVELCDTVLIGESLKRAVGAR